MGTTLNQSVCQELAALCTHLENDHKKLCSSADPMFKQYLDAQAHLTKARDKYYSACKEQSVTKATMLSEGSSANLSKRLTKVNAEVEKAEDEYKLALVVLNTRQEAVKKHMPAVMAEYQQLLRLRAEKLRILMTVYVNTHKHALEEQMAILNDLQQVVDTVNSSDEIAQVTEATAIPAPKNQDFQPYTGEESASTASATPSSHSRPTSVGPAGSSSPGSKTLRGFFRKKLTQSASLSSTLSNSSYASDSEASYSNSEQKSSNSHFGVPLDVLTKREGNNLPSILKFLVEQTIKHGGTHARGIFRLAADKAFIQAFTLRADCEGEFMEVKDPIDGGQLIKNWLRALPEPVIPTALYEEIVKPNQALKTFEKLQEPNKTVVGFVIKFLQFMNRPMFVGETMMGASNLSSMFAPCLIRCPYRDLSKSLIAAEKESSFVEDLIGQLDTDSFPSFDTKDESVRPPPVEVPNTADLGPPPAVSPDIPPPPVSPNPEAPPSSSSASSSTPTPTPTPVAAGTTPTTTPESVKTPDPDPVPIIPTAQKPSRPHPPPVIVSTRAKIVAVTPEAGSPLSSSSSSSSSSVHPPPPMPMRSSSNSASSPSPAQRTSNSPSLQRPPGRPKPQSSLHESVEKVRTQLAKMQTQDSEDAPSTPPMTAPEPPCLESPKGDAPEPPSNEDDDVESYSSTSSVSP